MKTNFPTTFTYSIQGLSIVSHRFKQSFFKNIIHKIFNIPKHHEYSVAITILASEGHNICLGDFIALNDGNSYRVLEIQRNTCQLEATDRSAVSISNSVGFVLFSAYKH